MMLSDKLPRYLGDALSLMRYSCVFQVIATVVSTLLPSTENSNSEEDKRVSGEYLYSQKRNLYKNLFNSSAFILRVRIKRDSYFRESQILRRNPRFFKRFNTF